MEKNNKNMYAFSASFIVISLFLAATFGAFVTSFIKSSTKNLLYISQEEVLEFEKKRVSSSKYEDRAIFFNKPNKAAILLQELGDTYRDDKNMVIYSVGKVVGENAKSISKQVHVSVIEEMVNDKN